MRVGTSALFGVLPGCQAAISHAVFRMAHLLMQYEQTVRCQETLHNEHGRFTRLEKTSVDATDTNDQRLVDTSRFSAVLEYRRFSVSAGQLAGGDAALQRIHRAGERR